MSRDIKQHLKEARNAIKDREYKNAIHICKDVLKFDEKNYMAHILLGAAYQESDKEQAANFLHKAVSLSKDPILALQGLVNCAKSNDLPSVFEQLLTITPDKFEDLHIKILNLSKQGDQLEKCLEIYKKELKIEHNEENKKRRISANKFLCEIYLKDLQIDEKWLELFENALENYIEASDSTNCLHEFKAYIKLLYKLKKIDKVIKYSIKMLNTYPNEITPLEWICKAYVENYGGEVFQNVDVQIYINSLLNLQLKSILGLIAKGIYSYESGDYYLAKESLEKVNELKPNWNVCLNILANVNFKLGAYSLTEYILRQLKKDDDPLLIKCLIEQKIESKLIEGLKLCKDLIKKTDREDKLDLTFYLIKGLIYNEQYEEADKELEIFHENNRFTILKSIKYRILKNYEKSIELLLAQPQKISLYFLELGKTYFEIENYEKSLISFLNATKLDIYNSECFLWLGKIYSKNFDDTRAKKCLEKCLSLNIQNKEAIILLSSIYRQNNELELNQILLENLVKSVESMDDKGWALRQSGLNLLAMMNSNEAINAFRAALRCDSNDISNWEGLADSYLARGSYNSAMKVYKKTSELEPNNLYTKFQVGRIHLILMMFNEAIECFLNILKEDASYFPALKGIAEAYFGSAQRCHKLRLFGRSREHIQQCLNYTLQIIQIKSNISCLWRLLANCLDFIALYPKTLSYLEVPGTFAGYKEDFVVLKGEKLFELASRCYCRAIKINQNESLLWYELAANQYHRAIKYGTKQTKSEYLQVSLETIKNAIKLNAMRWISWNLLGVICSTEEINNHKLAQHSFIKAVTIDKKSYTSWTNLGVLYLMKDEIKLANKAFGMSQQSEPNYINAWAGQALIAEQIAEVDEALDLFRHCTQLGFHPEAALGYAHWVCSILENPKNLEDPKYKYSIEHMFAVPVASDSINWFIKNDDTDSSVESLSFMGYLSCRQGLWSSAAKVFNLAVEKSTGETKDLMLCNLGYSLLKLNKGNEAAKAFHSVSEATYKSTVGLALAYFKIKEYDESYSTYESALQWLASNDTEKSLILIAMSAMVYAFHGADDAKTVLFQCISLADPPVEGLFSACALGILQQDSQLSELVVKELQKYEDNKNYCHHIAFLKAEIISKQKNRKKALIYLQSRVHRMPHHALLRKTMAYFLLKHFAKSAKHSNCASRVVQSSIVLDIENINKNASVGAAQSYAMASHAMRLVDLKQRKLLAEKAVHINPCCKEAWGSLIACKS